MAKRKYAKVGELVKIVIPKFFRRCGYPLDSYQVKHMYGHQLYSMVNRAWEAMFASQDDDGLVDEVKNIHARQAGPTSITRELLMKAACLAILTRENWGGNERIIQEEEVSNSVKNPIYKVIAKTFVKTGTRATTSQGYYATKLLNQKVHCVYLLQNKNAEVLEVKKQEKKKGETLCEKTRRRKQNRTELMHNFYNSTGYRVLATNCEIYDQKKSGRATRKDEAAKPASGTEESDDREHAIHCS